MPPAGRISDPSIVLDGGDILYVSGELDVVEFVGEEYGLALVNQEQELAAERPFGSGEEAVFSANGAAPYHKLVQVGEESAMRVRLARCECCVITVCVSRNHYCGTVELLEGARATEVTDVCQTPKRASPQAKLSKTSDLIGRTVREVSWQGRFGLIPVAIQRGNGREDGRLSDVVLAAGDVLLLDTSESLSGHSGCACLSLCLAIHLYVPTYRLVAPSPLMVPCGCNPTCPIPVFIGAQLPFTMRTVRTSRPTLMASCTR